MVQEIEDVSLSELNAVVAQFAAEWEKRRVEVSETERRSTAALSPP
jgi:hypothetical protein